MSEVVFLLEEPSAKVLLQGLFHRIIPIDSSVSPRFIVFDGKQDLDRQLGAKLRGYMNPQAVFIVLRDQDEGDCHRVKRSLKEKCKSAGKPEAIVRVACRELEAFYLGDLRAVERGLEVTGLALKQNKAAFRLPDSVHRPSRELERISNKQYQKVAGSRAIAPHLDLENRRSRSFANLIGAIRTAGRRAGADLG